MSQAYALLRQIALDPSQPRSVRQQALMSIVPYSTDDELHELERELGDLPASLH